METALYRPLAEISPPEWERMAPKTGEISALQRQILLGLKGGKEQERHISQMVQTLRHHIRDETAIALTGAENEGITWFFSAFPNRYLLSTNPATLATQLAKFADFKTARIKVDVVPSQGGHPEGLLIYTRQLPDSHSRVAYSLSRKRLNILSGKVNRVNFHEGGHGYCYYFQISRLSSETTLFPRDLETMILSEAPPEPGPAERRSPYRTLGVRVTFRGDDGKGYLVEPDGAEFRRRSVPYQSIQIVLRDEPYLYYKVSRAFDQFKVDVKQALITTTGNQVMDYFYLETADYDRLRNAHFEEAFIDALQVSLT